jgi:hydroxymethylglutaryl-CoA lyase
MNDTVVFTDVGPRDGLQNQPKILTVEERLALIAALSQAGVSSIEVGSFVSPRAVPAMAGTDQVVAGLPDDAVSYSALIPNKRGYELARAAGVKTVNMVLYASAGMAQKNVNMSIAQAGPYDGPTDPGVVRDIAARFIDQGLDQIVLADTIGAANPGEVRSLTADLVREHGTGRIGCHFHDTRAMGVANVFAALESGIYHFDGSIAGLGGCPFAPGASGNVASEDVIMMLEQMGVDTGIDLDALLRASDLAEELTGTAPGGRAKAWLKPWLAKQA